jgi:hypothetical protein
MSPKPPRGDGSARQHGSRLKISQCCPWNINDMAR